MRSSSLGGLEWAPLTHKVRAQTEHQGRHGTTLSINDFSSSVSGLVVKSIVAIDGPRVRFAADATHCFCWCGLCFELWPRELEAIWCVRGHGICRLKKSR